MTTGQFICNSPGIGIVGTAGVMVKSSSGLQRERDLATSEIVQPFRFQSTLTSPYRALISIFLSHFPRGVSLQSHMMSLILSALSLCHETKTDPKSCGNTSRFCKKI